MLLVIATMIACFGLVQNSTAVIIGAMLVSPLMTPIFGITVGLLRGDARLLFASLRAELGGVILAIAAAFLFGMLPFYNSATPEMLSRTEPNLIDLMVAVFAGMAGAYALVDERVSPALPGVAIATAIVPPLSTCGMCLAMQSYEGAAGAMLLFSANFVAILLVSSVLFSLAGLAPVPTWNRWKEFARRYGATIVGFAVIAGVLSHSLVVVIQERRTVALINQHLTFELSKDAAMLDQVDHEFENGRLYVLAVVRAPEIIPPNRVTNIRDGMAQKLGTPTELIVRTILARDVVSIGSKIKANETDLNGVFFGVELSGIEAKERQARQLLHETLSGNQRFSLHDLNYFEPANRPPFVLAEIASVGKVRSADVTGFQQKLRKGLSEPELELIVKATPSTLHAANGAILFEWHKSQQGTNAEVAMKVRLRKLIESHTNQISDITLVNVHHHMEGERWRLLLEVVGPRSITPQEVAELRKAMPKFESHSLEINVWQRFETVVSPGGHHSFEEFTEPTLQQRIHSLPLTQQFQ